MVFLFNLQDRFARLMMSLLKIPDLQIQATSAKVSPGISTKKSQSPLFNDPA